MQDRPVTTLFLLQSLDGKISTGNSDERDVDADFARISGLKEGLHQYYEIEQTTDLWSFNSGRVQNKMGVNTKAYPAEHGPVSFAVIDNHHLTKHGVEYFTHWAKTFVLFTSNKNHPAFQVKSDTLHIYYADAWTPTTMLHELYRSFNCERITVQTGGTLNALFIREKVIDFVDIVVAPALIGGKDTSSLVDGSSFTTDSDLKGIGVLQLISAEVLKDNYLRLKYKMNCAI